MKYKTDGNQGQIVAALKAAGYIVDDNAREGRGRRDLVVWTKTSPRVAVPMEVKNRGGKYTKRQKEYNVEHEDCLMVTVWEPQEAVDTMRLIDIAFSDIPAFRI